MCYNVQCVYADKDEVLIKDMSVRMQAVAMFLASCF